MNMSTAEEQKFFIITPEESRLDARIVNEFKQKVQNWVAEGKTKILLDMRNIDFMDSSGLGAVVACLKSVGSEGDMQLCSVKPPVMSLMKLTRLDQIFVIHEDQSEALVA